MEKYKKISRRLPLFAFEFIALFSSLEGTIVLTTLLEVKVIGMRITRTIFRTTKHQFKHVEEKQQRALELEIFHSPTGI